MPDNPTTKEREPRNSIRSEAMCHVIGLYGPLTERETQIAEAAARSAFRWTLREVTEDLAWKMETAS